MGGCTRCYGNSVYFHTAVDGNDQALASVNFTGFNQISVVWIDLDDNVRSFDFKGPGVGDIACVDGSFFTGGFIEVLIKGGKLFFLDAAVL